MSDFQAAMAYVLSNEGGLVADPAGGLTNFGLSQNAYPTLDIRNLTRGQAIAIYQRDYWVFGDVTDQRLATKIFDAYVNMKTNAIRCLQLALGYLQAGPIVADGQWGPQTLAHVNAADPEALLDEFKARLVKFYRDDVEANPAMVTDLMGWFRRAVKG